MVNNKDCRMDFYDNASPGDFYRVKCRITHVPTGTVATSHEHQTQTQAALEAFSVLDAAIAGLYVGQPRRT
jgi:protein subunit release factor A